MFCSEFYERVSWSPYLSPSSAGITGHQPQQFYPFGNNLFVGAMERENWNVPVKGEDNREDQPVWVCLCLEGQVAQAAAAGREGRKEKKGEGHVTEMSGPITLGLTWVRNEDTKKMLS